MKAKIIVDSCCHVPNAHLPNQPRKGKSACGILVIDEFGNENELGNFMGELTPPAAEFSGLINALDRAAEFTRADIEIWMDSELVVRWMNGVYKMRKEHIRPLFDKAKKFEKRYKSVEYFHHSENSALGQRAHRLAEQYYQSTQ